MLAVLTLDSVESAKSATLNNRRLRIAEYSKSQSEQEPFVRMDYLDKVLEKLKEWGRRLIEALLGPEAEPEAELIPIPVNDPQRPRRN